ncbi:hypothetical protein K438DRAFT_1825725 [Mycena galopus ATCC 62051]|nr:hypothetical protein K438DRAFT_1825725 [Mycena galopus ATCC 62051]
MTLMHPSAIWLYLAQLFPRDILVGLITADYTTRAVLSERVEASLEKLYREVELRFLHLNDGTVKRLWFERAVADRVHILSVGPYFVCDALDNSQWQPFPHTSETVRALLARFRNLEQYHILWHERPTATLRRTAPKYDDSTLCLLQTLYSRRPRRDLDAAGYIMVHHLARFLNNTYRTLRSLSFETSLAADFSPLFSALVFFAHLSSLAFSIPMSDPYLGDPSAVKRFLHLHCDTLKHLSLRGFCTRRTEMDGRWLSRCLTGITFISLERLDVGTSFIPLDVAMLCVRQWADTLTALDIVGQYLSYDAVEDMLRELSAKRLQNLTVGVTCLCPELVDMFAEHLPGLTKLNLRIRFTPKAVGRLGDSRRYLGGSREQVDSQSKERFWAEMSTRKYKAWRLRDVGVSMFTKKLEYQRWCANVIRECVGEA